MIRNDWTKEKIAKIYHLPLLELVYQASTIHRQYHDSSEVQVCTLLSIKTGGCQEDCAYCPQAARYDTNVEVHPFLSLETVMESARDAKASGATRFCMGASLRAVRDNKDFDAVLEMVKSVNQLGLEVCCTLGMLTESQARRLKEAGLHAYNHNLDTSEAFYEEIITTRTYEDRLKTLNNVRSADITVCCGGIIGMGESDQDRIDMLYTLATLDKHPESVPINALVSVKGTPLENRPPVEPWELVRMIATARILMPASMIRLSAGRLQQSQETQALCFMAGANSIFAGEKLLTTANPCESEDKKLFKLLGLTPRQAFKEQIVETKD